MKISIRKPQERLQILQDSHIVIPNATFEAGDLVLIHNETKQNKLDSERKERGTVLRRSSGANFEIFLKIKILYHSRESVEALLSIII